MHKFKTIKSKKKKGKKKSDCDVWIDWKDKSTIIHFATSKCRLKKRDLLNYTLFTIHIQYQSGEIYIYKPSMLKTFGPN